MISIPVIQASRVVLAVVLAGLMVLSGSATYIVLSSRTSKIAKAPEKPTAATPAPQALTLPGTIYLSQEGAIYSLSGGKFHELTVEAGWMQPSLAPDGNIIAVKRDAFSSDVYVISPSGSALRQVTNNAAPARLKSDTGQNHWSFYPRVSADGRTLWMSYDDPKFGYDVVLSIWAMPYAGSLNQGRLWTNAADYTGGDVQPVPVAGGGIIYTKYDFGPDNRLVGRLWFTNRAYSFGKALTSPDEDCRNPSMSPDGTQVAMVCTYEKQVAYLTIATWNGSTLGPRRNIVTSQLVAQPTWAPDGSGIAYLAPNASSNGDFQLWWLPKAFYAPPPVPVPTPTPGGPHNGPLPASTPPAAPVVKPIEVTTNNGFDATSPLAWGS